jgi:hypothetical protein
VPGSVGSVVALAVFVQVPYAPPVQTWNVTLVPGEKFPVPVIDCTVGEEGHVELNEV